MNLRMKNVKIDETVRGEGESTVDALQHLHEALLVRAEEVALELRKLRGERL